MTVSPTAGGARAREELHAEKLDFAPGRSSGSYRVSNLAVQVGPVGCPVVLLLTSKPSRRRDCHSAAPPSTLSRRFNSDGESASAK